MDKPSAVVFEIESSPTLSNLSETKSSPTLLHPSLRLAETCMTRSSSNILYKLDPEIDRTLCTLRKVRSTVISNSGSSISVSNFGINVSTTNDSDFSEYSSSDINHDFNFVVSKSQEPESTENNDQTLKELATPNVVYQPWCIQYPQLEPAQSYELKYGLIHLLPKFHGPAAKDPHKHLKELHMVNSTMRP
ncbi:hypothetical protein CR513_15728, partial [Mucuna pruriens]